jgi:hypothetical protein
MASRNQNRTPGNTIRKVYLCRAQTRSLKAGDILLFYLSQDKKMEASQCITTVGIVEQWNESASSDSLVLLTAKRSVFSQQELIELQNERPSPLKVIDFLLTGHLTPAVPLSQLLTLGIFNGRPPQSIAEIDHERYLRLRPFVNLGFEL